MFFTLFGYWLGIGWGEVGGGGGARDWYTTCLYANRRMPYLHVFHPIWVLGPGGGVSQGIGTQPAYAVFHPG